LSATSSAANNALGTMLSAMKAIHAPPSNESMTMQRNCAAAGFWTR